MSNSSSLLVTISTIQLWVGKKKQTQQYKTSGIAWKWKGECGITSE